MLDGLATAGVAVVSPPALLAIPVGLVPDIVRVGARGGIERLRWQLPGCQGLDVVAVLLLLFLPLLLLLLLVLLLILLLLLLLPLIELQSAAVAGPVLPVGSRVVDYRPLPQLADVYRGVWAGHQGFGAVSLPSSGFVMWHLHTLSCLGPTGGSICACRLLLAIPLDTNRIRGNGRLVQDLTLVVSGGV